MEQVEINFALVKGIIDDVDFCDKLAKEESVILLPGMRIFFSHQHQNLGIFYFINKSHDY